MSFRNYLFFFLATRTSAPEPLSVDLDDKINGMLNNIPGYEQFVRTRNHSRIHESFERSGNRVNERQGGGRSGIRGTMMEERLKENEANRGPERGLIRTKVAIQLGISLNDLAKSSRVSSFLALFLA